MAAPLIALRFRDSTPNVDTIEAHLEIIRREGSVWWGWWKKSFEENRGRFLNSLKFDDAIKVLLVDRSTKRMFVAVARKWSKDEPPKSSAKMVPEYYRAFMSRVFGWFLLESIENAEYDESIAQRFGDRTFIRLDDGDEGEARAAVYASSAANKSCLLHLSDLHFGKDYAFASQGQKKSLTDFRMTLTASIVEDLKRIGMNNDIAAVVVTGDFTTQGDWSGRTKKQVLDEFAALQKALCLKQDQIIAIPGNHDIVRYGPNSTVDPVEIALDNQIIYEHEEKYRIFAEQLMGRGSTKPLDYVKRFRFKEADLLMCVLNSCRIAATKWTEYGYVGDGVDTIAALESEDISRPSYKFLALHHHLLPVTKVETPSDSGVTLSLDASAILDAAQIAGVHVAIHGHQHMPKIARYQTIPINGTHLTKPLYVVSNGSSGAIQSRLPGNERNTYCLFRLSVDEPFLWMRELRPDGHEGKSLFEAKLAMPPAMPPGSRSLAA